MIKPYEDNKKEYEDVTLRAVKAYANGKIFGCPACGAAPKVFGVFSHRDGEVAGYVQCSSCGMSTAIHEANNDNFAMICDGFARPIEYAVHQWNKRDESQYKVGCGEMIPVGFRRTPKGELAPEAPRYS